MAYLTQTDLTTHLYPEIITEIIRDYSTTYANQAAFPAIGITGRRYVSTADSKTFIWNGDAYVETTPFDLPGKAISAAVAEVKSYLSRYDLLKLFGNDVIPPEVNDEHLKNIVKDVAVWYLLRLANPNIDLALFRTIYEDAIKWLTLVQKGQADPEGWPYPTDDADTDYDESAGIQWSSNPKRGQHY